MDKQFAAVAIRIAEEKIIESNFIEQMFGYGKNLADIYLHNLTQFGVIKQIEENRYEILITKNEVQNQFKCGMDVVCSPKDLEKYVCLTTGKKVYKFNFVYFACDIDVGKYDIEAGYIVYAHDLTAHRINALIIDQCINLTADILKAQSIHVFEKIICRSIECPNIFAKNIFSNNILSQQIQCSHIHSIKE